MHILIDVALVLIFGWSVYSYVKNGLIKSLINAGKFLISFILACVLVKPIGNAIASARNLSDTASQIACKAITFVGIFLISLILVSILGTLLQKVAKLPVLHQVDKIAGLALGIVVGFLKVFVLSSIFKMILNFGIVKNGAEIAANTVIFEWLANTNIITNFVKMILDAVK